MRDSTNSVLPATIKLISSIYSSETNSTTSRFYSLRWTYFDFKHLQLRNQFNNPQILEPQMNVFWFNKIWWKWKKNHRAVKKLLTVRIILNHKKLACKFIFLHISAFQPVLPIFSDSFRMFRQFDLLSTLFMSLTFRISDRQMHVTCYCKSIHCIYAKSFASAV